jgi:hypothetical protein
VVRVAFVQGIVSALDKHFRPLNERRSQETGEGTDDNFLEKRGLHHCFDSSDGARTPQSLALEAACFGLGMRVADFSPK